MMKKESTGPSKRLGKSTMTLEQALAAPELTQIIIHFKRLSDEEVCAKWKGLASEAKEKVLAAARDGRGKNATERRVALAHAIAVADAAAAISLLQQSLVDTAQARQSIGKVWFVESRGWIGLDAINIGESGGILQALIDVASDPNLLAEMKNKTKGVYVSAERKLYDFSRWAMRALAQLPDGQDDKRAKVQRLIGLSKNWPEEWRNEVKSLAAIAPTPLTDEGEKQSPAPDAIIARETGNQPPAPEAASTEIAVESENQSPAPRAMDVKVSAEIENQSSAPAVMKVGLSAEAENRTPALDAPIVEMTSGEALKEVVDGVHSQMVQHSAPTPAPEPQRVAQVSEEELSIDQARHLIRLREEEIAQKQAEAATLTRLIETLLTTREENAHLKQRLSEADERFAGLRNSNAQLEARLTRVEEGRQEAETLASRLSEEVERLKTELAAEKAARADEQRWTAEQIEREIKYELNGFKERLAAKLAPIFIEKRRTDPQPADAELAEFLRRWFQDIEGKLQEQGISFRKD